MHTQLWQKYLPIIKILLKRSATADQTLNMNATDFERSGVARKAGSKFLIVFIKGRVDNIISASALAKDLAGMLLQDKMVTDLFSQNDYHISLNTKYQLGIRLIAKEPAEDQTSETKEAEVNAVL